MAPQVLSHQYATYDYYLSHHLPFPLIFENIFEYLILLFVMLITIAIMMSVTKMTAPTLIALAKKKKKSFPHNLKESRNQVR